jgi:methionyl-tRNA synthetase
MLEPEELIDPKCKLCGATPEMKDTKQIYLRLSALQDGIQKNADKKKDFWTNNAIGMTGKYLKEGLRDRAVTRNISWGVPMPDSAKHLLGDLTDKKIYIWAENVLGYFAATKEVKTDWEKFLSDDTETKKIHYYVHAKDNIPFHSVILPGLLLADNTHKWHLPDRIIAGEYITMNGKKISKSDGNYITARELIDNFDIDFIRYYFLRNINDKKDADFSFRDFVNTVNGELADNFGNLVNRTLTFIKNKFDGKIPAGGMRHMKKINAAKKEVGKLIEKGYCSKALLAAMQLVTFGNKWFNDNAPWKTLNKAIIADCVEIIRAACEMLCYFIPLSAEKVFSWIAGDKLGDIDILYKKIDLEDIEKKWPILK